VVRRAGNARAALGEDEGLLLSAGAEPWVVDLAGAGADGRKGRGQGTLAIVDEDIEARVSWGWGDRMRIPGAVERCWRGPRVVLATSARILSPNCVAFCSELRARLAIENLCLLP
jgi:hypothetical protein